MSCRAFLWATFLTMNEFEDIKLYVKVHYSSRVSNLQIIKIIYLAILTQLLVIDEGITDEHMKLVDPPPSMFRQVTITNAFIDFFNRAENNALQYIIKDEIVQLYKKHKRKELFSDAINYFGE